MQLNFLSVYIVEHNICIILECINVWILSFIDWNIENGLKQTIQR